MCLNKIQRCLQKGFLQLQEKKFASKQETYPQHLESRVQMWLCGSENLEVECKGVYGMTLKHSDEKSQEIWEDMVMRDSGLDRDREDAGN